MAALAPVENLRGMPVCAHAEPRHVLRAAGKASTSLRRTPEGKSKAKFTASELLAEKSAALGTVQFRLVRISRTFRSCDLQFWMRCRFSL